MIRVLIVAHSMIMRAGLETMVSTEAGLTVVGSIADSDSVEQQIEQLQPDVILLEWTAQEDEGPSLLLNSAVNSAAEFAPRLVLLVEDYSDSSITELLRAGVRGVLPMEASTDEIVGAIAAAATGLTVMHPDITEALLPLIATSFRPMPETLPQPLTSREVEVLGMLAQGLGNKTIARRLTISEHTVKFHISSIFSKLNASSRTEAVILGARQGLILI